MDAEMPTYNPSAEAVAPLLDTFWSADGWREPPTWPSHDVKSRAVADGVMFDHMLSHDHDGWVRATRHAVREVSATEVGCAFLASLTSHRLDLRSALGSYAVAQHLPEHPRLPANSSGICGVCGLYDEREEDLNELNFERFKWGGIDRDSISYAAFDLQQFTRAPRLSPTQADIDICQRLIDKLRQLPPETTAQQATPHMKVLKGNKAEREAVLDTLGVCGILQTEQYPGYAQSFVNWADRTKPLQRHVFKHFPICWWKAADGVDLSALRQFLPQIA